ncbi:DMT family transporter [Salinactinospora qingdaonensis]|uniref:DMT family transporter n=1 Tax=Salinactinospora qingdaonensis TaxID=702744 RepID=A0ABP7GFK7_9ACTN
MAEPMRGDRMWAVAVAAGLWGTSALLREPLVERLPAPTIVFFEHLVIVACLLPWIGSAMVALARCGRATVLAMLVVGGGSSAVATTLFTAAFAVGDPVTPQVLQKLQPVFAVVLAMVVLGERVTPRFAYYAVPALVGTWLLAFADPLSISVGDAMAALLAVGAAVLWASGTVLGRFAGLRLSFMHVTAVRFTVALPVTLVLALGSGASLRIGAGDVVPLIGVALIPGLGALLVYYWGLSRTAASRATIAELTFPFVSALVGVTALGASLSWSQWSGAGVLLVAVTAMTLSRSSSRPSGVIDPARLTAGVSSPG